MVYDALMAIYKNLDGFGQLPEKDMAPVQVEYVSANPTGPLHVGHGRGAAAGSALVNVLRAAGYPVVAEYYINDAGNQINNLAKSVDHRYLELLGKADEASSFFWERIRLPSRRMAIMVRILSILLSA